MLYVMAAQAFILAMDFGLDIREAALWVVRRRPANLRNYWVGQIAAEFYRAGGGSFE